MVGHARYNLEALFKNLLKNVNIPKSTLHSIQISDEQWSKHVRNCSMIHYHFRISHNILKRTKTNRTSWNQCNELERFIFPHSNRQFSRRTVKIRTLWLEEKYMKEWEPKTKRVKGERWRDTRDSSISVSDRSADIQTCWFSAVCAAAHFPLDFYELPIDRRNFKGKKFAGGGERRRLGFPMNDDLTRQIWRDGVSSGVVMRIGAKT